MSKAEEGTQRLPIASRHQVRQEFGRLLRTHRWPLVGVLLLNCLAAASGLAGPTLVGRIVDKVQEDASLTTIDRLAFTVVGFVVVQILFTRAARLAAHRFSERTTAQVRAEYFTRLVNLPVTVVERSGLGDLATRSSVDISTVGVAARNAAPDLLIATLHIVFVLVVVFLTHPLLGLCGLVGIPAIWLVTRWYVRRGRNAYLDEGAANAQLAEVVVATAEGARTIETYGLQERQVENGDLAIGTSAAARVRTLRLRTVFFPSVDVAHTLPVAAALLLGGGLHARGSVSLGAVVAVSLYLWQLVDPVDKILMWVDQIQLGAASFARIIGVRSASAEQPHGTVSPRDNRLEIRDVRFGYADCDVLHGIDLTIEPGERVAIVGPSGAGKSTLGRLIAGLDAPRLGLVTLGDVPVHTLDPAERTGLVALVTQEHHVFVGTIRENLSLAAPAASDKEITAALIAVNALWWETLPEGLDTVVGDGGIKLDAPQAQQIALARLVLADPHTLVLDEATAALDPSAARQTERALALVMRGRTVIAIAHRLSTALDADRIVVMDGGKVLEVGSHDELLSANGAYARLWRSWHGEGATREPRPSSAGSRQAGTPRS
ncbi:ABC transporter ATP-binding protein [Plantactinospora sp. ZYX-F-223]|uniref:ABC transporter ATP-binding protein n=1 Tax=Plantactinospora sp. ZYX-F-223 TaxID=3144103 RepID=UPI0031FDBF09